MRRLIYLSHNLEQRQLGPAGLRAFTVSELKPVEFREMAKRTFNVGFTRQELGALTKFFDTRLNNTVDCSAFVNTYTQIRTHCEPYKVS
jgi:hypothetical protein